MLKAAKALAAEIPDLKLGRFTLDKRLPVAAGLGGGSSDAGAALRLLARANRLKLDDRRLQKVARRLGADVPVCVDPRPRRMRGIGEMLSAPLAMPKLAAVLVNPGVAVPTRDVFAMLGLKPGGERTRAATDAGACRATRDGLIEFLAGRAQRSRACRDQAPAGRSRGCSRRCARSHGCELARMSGSGATCFGLFTSARAAAAAARILSASSRAGGSKRRCWDRRLGSA